MQKTILHKNVKWQEKRNMMKFEFKKDVRRFIVICIASVLMAVNIKTFVRTGGYIPVALPDLLYCCRRYLTAFLVFLFHTRQLTCC